MRRLGRALMRMESLALPLQSLKLTQAALLVCLWTLTTIMSCEKVCILPTSVFRAASSAPYKAQQAPYDPAN